jgi:hypothetical protein
MIKKVFPERFPYVSNHIHCTKGNHYYISVALIRKEGLDSLIAIIFDWAGLINRSGIRIEAPRNKLRGISIAKEKVCFIFAR